MLYRGWARSDKIHHTQTRARTRHWVLFSFRSKRILVIAKVRLKVKKEKEKTRKKKQNASDQGRDSLGALRDDFGLWP